MQSDRQDSDVLEPEAAFAASGFDFTTFLAHRLGTPRERAHRLLGQWLVHYEPAASSQLRKTQANEPAELTPVSGPRWTAGLEPDELRSGTNG
jgi:hypothetical protein